MIFDFEMIKEKENKKHDLLKLAKEWSKTYPNPITQKTQYANLVGMVNKNILDMDNDEEVYSKIKENYPNSIGTQQTKSFIFYSFKKWCQKNYNYSQPIKPEKRKKPNKRTVYEALSKKEMTALLANISHKEAFLIASLQAFYTKRFSEVMELNYEDIDIKNKTIKFKTKKTKYIDDHITIFIKDIPLLKALNQLMNKRKISNKSMPFSLTLIKYNNHLKEAAKKINLPFSISSHNLRSTAITNLLRSKKVSLNDIRRLAGHSSIQQTIYYDKQTHSENISKTMDLSHMYL